ncbi:hypothetical protein TNCV_1988331 [Trichonephila clavipes]|nr:hypothetical protein TNCV_1988331 [Trichonephila clavipes]
MARWTSNPNIVGPSPGCGCSRNPFRGFRPKSIHSSGCSAGSGTPSVKGHGSSSALVLDIRLPLQHLSSFFEEEKTNVQAQQPEITVQLPFLMITDHNARHSRHLYNTMTHEPIFQQDKAQPHKNAARHNISCLRAPLTFPMDIAVTKSTSNGALWVLVLKLLNKVLRFNLDDEEKEARLDFLKNQPRSF